MRWPFRSNPSDVVEVFTAPVARMHLKLVLHHRGGYASTVWVAI